MTDHHFAPFAGRLGIIQRVLPVYRTAFFDQLAKICTGGLSVLAGQPLPIEAIATAKTLQRANLHLIKNLHLFNPSLPLYLCWQQGVLAWLDAWQPDVLIVESNPRILTSPGAVSWMHQRNRPVLGWGLGVPSQSGWLGRVQTWHRAQFLQHLDGIIAYSQTGAMQYQNAGFPPERVFIAKNAVTPRPPAPLSERARPTLEERPVVLFVGRLQQRKRIDLLLRACANLPENLQPRLWIVGDGPARPEFEQLAHMIFPATTFFGGRFGDDLDQIFASATLFVLPGTGGLAIQQAMAHGLPVVVAQADGTQDDLVRPESGWQVPPGDLETLQRVLFEALSDHERLRHMGREAYRIVSEEINLETMAASFTHAASQILRLGLRS